MKFTVQKLTRPRRVQFKGELDHPLYLNFMRNVLTYEAVFKPDGMVLWYPYAEGHVKILNDFMDSKTTGLWACDVPAFPTTYDENGDKCDKPYTNQTAVMAIAEVTMYFEKPEDKEIFLKDFLLYQKLAN